MKRKFLASLLCAVGMVSQAQDVTVDFDGTEGTYLTQLATQPDEQTNITSFGHDTTFYAGVSIAPTPFVFTDQLADLSLGDALTFEGTFYNRNATGAHNEAYLWIGPDPSGNNIISGLPREVRQGISVGYFHLGSSIYDNGNDGEAPVLTVVDNDTSFLGNWITMAATFEVTGGNLVISQLTHNGVPIAGFTNYVVGPASDYPWLDAVHFGILVDDTIDGLTLSGPALVNNAPSAVPASSYIGLLLLVSFLVALGFRKKLIK